MYSYYRRQVDAHKHSLRPPFVEGSSMRDGGPPEIRHECFQSNCQLMLRLESRRFSQQIGSYIPGLLEVAVTRKPKKSSAQGKEQVETID